MHGDARRHEQADADRGGPERRIRQLLQPEPGGLRQQLGQHEEPQEQLHQQRHVAEELDPAEADPRRRPRRQRAQHADHRAGHQRDDPGEHRYLDGDHQPRQQQVEIGAGPHRVRLKEDVPVPVIVHGSPTRSRRSRITPTLRAASMQMSGHSPPKMAGHANFQDPPPRGRRVLYRDQFTR